MSVTKDAAQTRRRGKLPPGPGRSAQEVAAHQLARVYDATIELVAERGYGSLKVRDLVGYAEISTRAFYELFSSKEDCFLQTYNLISRRATQRIIAAQAEESGWRGRSRLVFEEFIRELQRGPAGARLALIDAYTAGEAALAQVWRTERTFEGVLAEALARTPEGIAVPPLIVQGMVAGVATVSKGYLLRGKVADLTSEGEELIDWAMSYPDQATARLGDLDSQSVWRDTALEPGKEPREEQWPSTGDRTLILKAVAELAAAKGYAGLTVPRIRSTAGVSRRKFDAHFDDVEDCYLAALEQRAAEALAGAARAQTAAHSPAGGTYRAIAALCDYVAADPFLARACLNDEFPPTPNGARAKKRLADATVELFWDSPSGSTRLATEASSAAVWSLFLYHVLREQATRPQIAATLAYLALAPTIGPVATVQALEREQGP